MSSSNESPHVTPVLDKEPQNILDIRGGKVEYEKFINDMIKGNLKKQSVPITLGRGPGGDQGIGYHRNLEAEINKCFKNLVPATPALRFDGEKAELSPDEFKHVYRTDVHDELMSNGKNSVNINCVFQVRLSDGTVNLDILIHRSNLYLVGYKCKRKNIAHSTEIVGNWNLLSGRDYESTAKSVEAHSTVEATKAELGMSYAALFGKYDSKFAGDMLTELSRNFDKDLTRRLGKARIHEADVNQKIHHTEKILNDGKKEMEKILNDGKKEMENIVNDGKKEWEKILNEILNDGKKEWEKIVNDVKKMKKHSEKKKQKAEKANKKLEKEISDAEMLLDWLPKKYDQLMAKKELEQGEYTKNMSYSQKKQWKQEMVDWIKEVIGIEAEDKKFDKVGGAVKVLRDYLKADFEKLQKTSIVAEKLKKKLEKKVSQASVGVQKSVARELLSWVEESKKGVDILSLVEKELKGEKNSVKSEEEEREKELKTELAALKNLVKKLKKRFSVGEDIISQVLNDGISYEKLKSEKKGEKELEGEKNSVKSEKKGGEKEMEGVKSEKKEGEKELEGVKSEKKEGEKELEGVKSEKKGEKELEGVKNSVKSEKKEGEKELEGVKSEKKEGEKELEGVKSEKKEGEKELEGVKSEKKEGEKELEGEKNSVKSEKKGEKELKTELAALENLVKKLKKRFSVGEDISQVLNDGIEPHEKLKRATKCLHDQYSQVPTKDRTDFRNELKYEAGMLNTAKKGLAIDAESKIVGAKMTSLKLINRDALRKAFKHLTENPFKDDEHFAGHIITLILMICEAARSKSITDHIRDFYEESTENTKPLTSEMIGMIYKWTEGSNILTRGVIYEGEVQRLANGSMDSTVDLLKNVQTLNGRSEEECGTE